MSKPSWDSAPEWANYLAMDDNGAWYWYQNAPYIDHKNPFSDGAWCERSGKYEAADFNNDWQDSLEPRPK